MNSNSKSFDLRNIKTEPTDENFSNIAQKFGALVAQRMEENKRRVSESITNAIKNNQLHGIGKLPQRTFRQP